MLPTKRRADGILLKQALAFASLIVLSWVSEILHVSLLFGASAEFNWARVIARTLVLVAVWAWMHWTTRRVLRRLHHLEEFVHVCSWCRKVGSDDQWLTMEDYFGEKFSAQTSHGICPACAVAAFKPLIPDPAEAD
ncbi:MAG: hypothetical protein HYV95_09835 [Opitutae bacterium]|nr:hypothetical protein [Opitutae bacterium]